MDNEKIGKNSHFHHGKHSHKILLKKETPSSLLLQLKWTKQLRFKMLLIRISPVKERSNISSNESIKLDIFPSYYRYKRLQSKTTRVQPLVTEKRRKKSIFQAHPQTDQSTNNINLQKSSGQKEKKFEATSSVEIFCLNNVG